MTLCQPWLSYNILTLSTIYRSQVVGSHRKMLQKYLQVVPRGTISHCCQNFSTCIGAILAVLEMDPVVEPKVYYSMDGAIMAPKSLFRYYF